MPTLAEVLRQTGYSQDGTLAAPASNSPMTTALSEHIKGLPQQFQQNQAEQMALLGQAFPGNTYKSMMTEGDPKAMAELAMQVPFNALTAFHGTPHKIKGAFDISKVGTGEGAQAYGHGMYFAEAPSVAESYKSKLSGGLGSPSNELIVNGQPLTNLSDTQRRAYEIVARDGRKNALGTAKDLEAEGFDASHIREALKATKGKEVSLTKNEGNLYKVDIPDEYIPNMLDWDKPLAQQNKQVLDALKKLDDPYINKAIKTQPKLSKDGEYWEYMGNTYGSKSEALEDATPHRIITGYTGLGKNPAEVSQTLNNVGIKGVSYLDQGSRIEGQGSRNFVVFDPSTVKILEENSKPLSRKELIEQQVNKVLE